ncbi:unnamed protein product, partial [Hapterophycus canaliculatus]
LPPVTPTRAPSSVCASVPTSFLPHLGAVYHSTSPHKEFRFLLPVLPIAHVYAGRAVSALLASAGREGG